jgi:hypothetical protein
MLKLWKNQQFVTLDSHNTAKEMHDMVQEGVAAGALPEGRYDFEIMPDGKLVNIYLDFEYLFTLTRSAPLQPWKK